MIFMEKQDRILVAGIGNTIRGDDGIGIYLTRRLKKVLPSRFDVKELSAGGLDLMQAISGYDKAILIDAIQTSGGATGEVYRLSLEDFKHSSNLSSTHALGLKEAVKLGIELAAENNDAEEIKKLNLNLGNYISSVQIEVSG